MDGFNVAFWNLEQVVAWAKFRNPDAVRISESGSQFPKEILSKFFNGEDDTTPIPNYLIAIGSVGLNKRLISLDEVNEDLWQRSGLPKQDAPTRIDYELSDLNDGFLLPEPWADNYYEIAEKLFQEGTVTKKEYFEFPIEKYLIHLITSGSLACFATPANGLSRRQLMPEEIAGYEIRAVPPYFRLAIMPSKDQFISNDQVIIDAQFERVHVFKLFPELADQDAFSDLELKKLIRELFDANLSIPQTEVVRIARQHGFKQSREKIREIIKSLNPNQKPGPKGPRNNRAKPFA